MDAHAHPGPSLFTNFILHLEKKGSFFIMFSEKIKIANTVLTHYGPVNSSTTTLWTGLFSVAGCPVSFYYYLSYRNSCI